jgi:hypothetical protein
VAYIRPIAAVARTAARTRSASRARDDAIRKAYAQGVTVGVIAETATSLPPIAMNDLPSP